METAPESADHWYLQGRLHRQQGDKAAAVGAFNQALKIRPDFADACLGLAGTLEEIGKFELAVKTYEHWLKILQAGVKKPAAAPPQLLGALNPWIKKGNDCLDRGETENAITAYGKALAIDPDFPPALINTGVALYHLRRLDEAERLLFHVLRVKPGDADALNTLGSCCKERGRLAQAVAAYRQVVAANPRHVFGWLNLGRCFMDAKLYAQGIEAYERVLALAPKHAEALAELTQLLHLACQWDKSEAIRERLAEALRAGESGDPFTVMAHLSALQRENARRWSKAHYPKSRSYDPSFPLPADKRGDGKFRIGYLSSDLQRHATAALITEMFELHDRMRFDIYAYSHGQDDGGEERRRIIRSVDAFRDIIALNDAQALELIKSDGIDILVDLKGYTKDHRLSLMALRPAPVSMHYLGYPGSLGADFIDYYIGDAQAPSDAFFEALIRLPHSYQINDRKRPLPEAGPRAAYGLPGQGFIFCDFNNVNKITPWMFAAWMRLLKAVEGSVLWLFVTHLHAIENLRREAQAHGVSPERLVLAAPAKMADHLARYRHVDLFLDTQPYSGHTTVSDALWCGVPVVTLRGEGFCSRVAAGLVQAVGLPELATNSLEEYEVLALTLARDKKRRLGIKAHLEKGRMAFPLFDSLATTRAIETAYEQAAEHHRQGQPPSSFAIPAK